MKKRQIDIQVKRGMHVKMPKSWFKDMANRVLDFENVEDSIEMSLVVTGRRTIRQLNKTYRKQDKYTDVLAFPMMRGIHGKDSQPFSGPPDGVTYLGEVFISYPVAVQQADELGHSIEAEMALLTTHGILHLLGYDHEQDRERIIMRNKEREILNLAGYEISK